MKVRLLEKNYEDMSKILTGSGFKNKRGRELGMVAAQAADPKTFFVGAEEGDRLVGGIMARHFENLILTFPATYVIPEFDGQGIEEAMIGVALVEAKRLNLVRSYVGLEDDGAKMREALYANGYKVVHVQEEAPQHLGILGALEQMGIPVDKPEVKHKKRYVMQLDLLPSEKEVFDRLHDWAKTKLFGTKKLSYDERMIRSMVYGDYGA
jgi:GNAT superfamily N-acetyltransferase